MQDATTPDTGTRTTQQVLGPERLGGAQPRRRFIASMQPVVARRHPKMVRKQAIKARGDTVLMAK
jgi:hypothetical protein